MSRRLFATSKIHCGIKPQVHRNRQILRKSVREFFFIYTRYLVSQKHGHSSYLALQSLQWRFFLVFCCFDDVDGELVT